MGETADTLAAGGGMRRQWVVAIEGIGTLVTSGSPAAALAAFADTDHTAAINGVVFQWGDGQEMKPWTDKIDVPIMSFGVQPDAADTFGVMVSRRNGGAETHLDVPPNLVDTTINVKSTAAFDSSGEIHIGTECIAYGGKTATTFTGCTRGMYPPGIELDVGGWPRPHSLPVVTQGVSLPVEVTSQPRVWRGRVVTITLHAVRGGVLDLRAEAQRVFTGRILGTRYDEKGWTWVDVESLSAVVRDKEMLSDQWSGNLREGIYLPSGWVFNAEDLNSGSASVADPLEVVVTGASGHLEINEGVYTIDELVDALVAWLAGESSAGNLGLQWSINPRYYLPDSGDLRCAIILTNGGATDNEFALYLPGAVKRFLGFLGADLQASWSGATRIYPSPEKPRRTLIYENSSLPIQNIRGTSFDNQDFLPPQVGASSSGDVMVIQLVDTGAMFLADITGSTLQNIQGHEGLDELTGIPWTSDQSIREIFLDDEREMRFRQVALIGGGLAFLVMCILASTGGDSSDVNGTDYDKLPQQLGCGLPLEILASLEADLESLAGATDDRILVIDRPTKLWEMLWGEFLIRAAALVWKNGLLRCATWSTPTAATAVHDFTQENKAEPAGVQGNHRAVAVEDDSFLRNVVTVHYNRDLRPGAKKEYRDDFTIKDIGAMESYGEREVTVRLPCTFAIAETSIDSVMGSIAGWMPLFSRPLWLLRRSIDMTLFEGVAPGDQGTLSDPHIKNPDDGTRGVDSKPILVAKHVAKWGGSVVNDGGALVPDPMVGEVELLMFPRDRVFSYSPCAQVDDGAANAGYNAGTATLTFEEHEFSESSQTVDVGRFESGDEVLIVEIDPAAIASPVMWQREILSVNAGANQATLTSGLSSPAWDNTKKYRMFAASYGDATSTQRAKAFQADDADMLIEDVRGPYEYGWQASQTVTWTDDTDTAQVDLPPGLAWGDGVALDVGYERSLFRLLNNGVNYRGRGVIANSLGATGAGTAAQVRSIIAIEEIYLGKMDLMNGDRFLWEAPFLRSTDGASATVYVTLCRSLPVGASRHIDDANSPAYHFFGTYQTESWTTSSTTPAVGAAASFDLGILDSDGHAFIVYEVTPKAETRGPALRRVGPYVES